MRPPLAPLHLVPHLPDSRHCQGRDGLAHTPGPTQKYAGSWATWEETQDKKFLLTLLSHIFIIQQTDGYGDTRMDNSQVSINKRNRDSRGPMPAQPHINNETAEPEWRWRRGSRLHCPGEGTDTNTAGTQTRARGPSPAPSHTPLSL